MPYSELLIGCGRAKGKQMGLPGSEPVWQNLTTLDINLDHNPDIQWDLNVLPLPFPDNSFDEIHAYEVLEHCGRQGDYKFFFAQFTDFHRILKPNGYLFAHVPSYKSLWAWGDPSHTRIFNAGSLVFLSQKEYEKQIGITAMSDFRYLYKVDFETCLCMDNDEQFRFILRAVGK